MAEGFTIWVDEANSYTQEEWDNIAARLKEINQMTRMQFSTWLKPKYRVFVKNGCAEVYESGRIVNTDDQLLDFINPRAKYMLFQFYGILHFEREI
jgi:hypothetical protein